MNLVVFCHDENSPFAQPEDCLSVAKLPGWPQIEVNRHRSNRIDARSA
jgi:hypothetical protein